MNRGISSSEGGTQNLRKRFPGWMAALAAAVLIYMAWYVYHSDALQLLDEDGETVISQISAVLVYIVAAVVTMAVFLCYAVFSSQSSYVKLLAVLWASLGLLWMVSMPVMSEADSKSHYLRAMGISEGQLLAERDEEGNASGEYAIPEEWTGSSEDNVRLSAYEALQYYDYDIYEEEPSEYHYNNTALYSPFSYLPQVIGLLIGKLLTGRIVCIVYAGRLANFLAIGMVWLMAVYFMPYSRQYIIWAALMPMNLHQSVSMAPDGMVTALVALMMAAVCRLRCDRSSRLTARMMVLLYVASFLLSQYKIVYVGACLMLFLIPREKFRSLRLYWMHVMILGVLVLASSLGWLSIASQNMLEQYADSHGQLMIVTKEPVFYTVVLIRTFYKKGLEYLNQLLGRYMGAILIENDLVLIYAVLALFILIAIAHRRQGSRNTGGGSTAKDRKESEKPILNSAARLNLFMVCVVTVLLICTSEYIQWTNYRESVVNGVQGRYFLPLIAPMLAAAFGIHRDDMERERAHGALLVGLNLCILLNVAVSFLYLTGSNVLY